MRLQKKTSHEKVFLFDLVGSAYRYSGTLKERQRRGIQNR
ncbi:hypothetical protein C4K37_2500 [Pseudomonas chlororaphis subsp. piscium]|nr:hypothetical protein C4K37_2500 [Pseudomonas chlororaphis subsp. piscium]AZC43432.1 hypothetical protein C4K36_2507 [Pseudomonas chlororaphis subsp. piscium]